MLEGGGHNRCVWGGGPQPTVGIDKGVVAFLLEWDAGRRRAHPERL